MTTPIEDPGESRERQLESLIVADPVAPKDLKVWTFAHLLRISEVAGIRHLKALISFMFVELAPSIPVSLRRSVTGNDGPRVALLGASITLIFCLLVPIAWTLAIGRFSSEKPGTLYLWQDKTNLILYSVVCPLYVGLGCWLAVTVIRSWSEIKEYAAQLDSKVAMPSRGVSFKTLLLVVLILSMGFFSTATYIGDILNRKNVKEQYWFMDLAASGEHILGSLGVYYFLINFVLLIVTLISITLFMSMFVAAMTVGRALESKTHPSDAELPVLEAKLAAFTESYILAKALTAIYMVNFYLWYESPLGATQNIYVAFIFLAMFGVLFVSLPRYFVELQWYRFMIRSRQIEKSVDFYEDIRPFWMRNIASVLDTLIIGTFVLGMLKEFITKGLAL